MLYRSVAFGATKAFPVSFELIEFVVHGLSNVIRWASLSSVCWANRLAASISWVAHTNLVRKWLLNDGIHGNVTRLELHVIISYNGVPGKEKLPLHESSYDQEGTS